MALPIHAAATAFVASYQRAMELAAHVTDTSLVAAALAAHYGPTHFFTLGQHSSAPSAAAATPTIQTHLDRFVRRGLGLDIRLVRHRVEPLSDATAMCWLTWGIRPANGVPAWEWENVYVYRRGGDAAGADEAAKPLGGPAAADAWTKPAGRWEMIIGDNEMAGLAARVPGFFDA